MPWIILLGFLVIAYKVMRVKIIIAVGIISSPVSLFLITSLLTVECYGPYTAKEGECKFNGTVTSQCPSGSGVLKAYHSKNAYAVGQNVSTTLYNILFLISLCIYLVSNIEVYFLKTYMNKQCFMKAREDPVCLFGWRSTKLFVQ